MKRVFFRSTSDFQFLVNRPFAINNPTCRSPISYKSSLTVLQCTAQRRLWGQEEAAAWIISGQRVEKTQPAIYAFRMLSEHVLVFQRDAGVSVLVGFLDKCLLWALWKLLIWKNILQSCFFGLPVVFMTHIIKIVWLYSQSEVFWVWFFSVKPLLRH